MTFKATITGSDSLRLAKLAEQHANDLFIPTRLTPDDAARYALDHFKRTVLATLERIELVADG